MHGTSAPPARRIASLDPVFAYRVGHAMGEGRSIPEARRTVLREMAAERADQAALRMKIAYDQEQIRGRRDGGGA